MKIRSNRLWLAVVLVLSIVGNVKGGDSDLKIIHINIGQGDATLILGPVVNGKRVSVLMDAGNITRGGGRNGGRIVGAVLFKNGIKTLDFFIASHYDADHIGGVIAGRPSMHGNSFLLGPDGEPGNAGDDDGDGIDGWNNRSKKVNPDPDELGAVGSDDIRVTTFVDRGDDRKPSSATYKKYIGMAKAVVAQGGSRESITSKAKVNSFEIDLGGGATMICLSANGFVRNRSAKVAFANTENERSLCFLIQLGGFDYLIGGDTIGRTFGSENAKVEKAIGEFLVDNDINVDVLHVNHHGGNNASEEEFLDMASPEIAIISAGNGNAHHHPNQFVLDRLVNAGVFRIYQTEWGTTRDETPETVRRRQAIFQGDIILTTDGTTYEISTKRQFEVDD